MKKLFGLLVVAGLFAMTACGGAKKTEEAAVDSTKVETPPPAPAPDPAPADTSAKKEEGKKEGEASKDGAKHSDKPAGH